MAIQTLVDPLTGKEIPSWANGIKGVQRGRSITPLNRTRLLLSSRPGKGKSTLIYSNPKAFVLDVDNGGGMVANPLALRMGPVFDEEAKSLTVPTIKDYLDTVQRLIQARKAGQTDIEMVWVDTVDSWFQQHGRELAKERNVETVGDVGSHGKGYMIMTDTLFNMLQDIQSAGMGWGVAAHITSKVVRGDSGDVVVHGLNLSNGPRSEFWGRCEHLLFLDDEVVPDMRTKQVSGKDVTFQAGTKKVRMLQVRPGGLAMQPGHFDDVKVRLDIQSTEISRDNGWADLEKAYQDAVDRLTGDKE